MDFELSLHLPALLHDLDEFIRAEIKPLRRRTPKFVDQRRRPSRPA
jgi:hypothetical protein